MNYQLKITLTAEIGIIIKCGVKIVNKNMYLHEKDLMQAQFKIRNLNKDFEMVSEKVFIWYIVWSN